MHYVEPNSKNDMRGTDMDRQYAILTFDLSLHAAASTNVKPGEWQQE